MAEIMQAYVICQTGVGADATPYLGDAPAWLGSIIGARKDERRSPLSLPPSSLEQALRRLAEQHGARAGLAIGEFETIVANFVPAQRIDFARAAAGQQDQADDVDLIAADQCIAVKDSAETLQILLIEKPPPRRATVTNEIPAGVGRAFRYQAPCDRLREHVLQQRQCPVCASGPCCSIVVVPAGDIRLGNAIDGNRGEKRQKRALQVAIIGPSRGGFPEGGAALPVERGEGLERHALGLCHCRLGTIASQQRMRSVARVLDRHVSSVAERDPSRPATVLKTHHPAFDTGWQHPEAEAGNLRVPEAVFSRCGAGGGHEIVGEPDPTVSHCLCSSTRCLARLRCLASALRIASGSRPS